MKRSLYLIPFLALALPLNTAAQLTTLWGMAPSGGANDKGIIFHVNTDGSGFQVVFHFDAISGWGPEGGLCLAPNGKFYGTTLNGGEGAPNAGTLFSFDPAGAGFHKIRDFNISNGGYNWGSLIVGSDGLLYGASYGGSAGGGSIYRVDPATDAYEELYALTQATDGGAINSALLQAADGLFYGTASMGGANNAGTIFKYDAVSDVFTKLHDIPGGTGGATPYGGLCQAANGWFYGTTYEGGTNDWGTLFKYDPLTDTYTKFLDLSTVNGLHPWSSMVAGGPDLLYGTIANGGLNSGGVLYSLVPSTDTYAELAGYSLATGANPLGGVLLGDDGLLYGMASAGGSGFFGSVYRYAPSTDQLNSLHDFSGGAANGSLPRGELILANASVGIAEAAALPPFTMGPNPCNGTLRLFWNDLVPRTARITVMDALGHVIRTGTYAGSISTLALDVPTGAYAVRVESGGIDHTVRILVQ